MRRGVRQRRPTVKSYPPGGRVRKAKWFPAWGAAGNGYKKTPEQAIRSLLRRGGVGGIRTLGTLMRYTRFPIVLVMTASIPLHRRVTRGIISAFSPLSSRNFSSGRRAKNESRPRLRTAPQKQNRPRRDEFICIPMIPFSAVAGNGFLSGEDQLVNVLGPGIPEDLHHDHLLSVDSCIL